MKCEDCNIDMLKNKSGEKFLCQICGKIYEKKNDKEKTGKDLPSKVEQAKNLGKSMVDFAKSGFKIEDEKSVEKRLAICNDCDRFDKGASRCLECGCFMRIKAQMSSSSCPLGKW